MNQTMSSRISPPGEGELSQRFWYIDGDALDNEDHSVFETSGHRWEKEVNCKFMGFFLKKVLKYTIIYNIMSLFELNKLLYILINNWSLRMYINIYTPVKKKMFGIGRW
jgi:hypothetical protein